jgi:hypothetical protein
VGCLLDSQDIGACIVEGFDALANLCLTYSMNRVENACNLSTHEHNAQLHQMVVLANQIWTCMSTISVHRLPESYLRAFLAWGLPLGMLGLHCAP